MCEEEAADFAVGRAGEPSRNDDDRGIEEQADERRERQREGIGLAPAEPPDREDDGQG